MPSTRLPQPTASSHDTPPFPTAIVIRGARVHTLKNLSCKIPHGQLTVVTGPSGSGKSSLAFDTLYAEGQRRYIESMSAYARQFLERIEKPDVDQVDHILPAIALEQKNSIKNARSTVGTVTDIYDYLRVLYAVLGETHCPQCGIKVEAGGTAQVLEAARALPSGSKLYVVAPVDAPTHSPRALVDLGYYRLVTPDGTLVEFGPQSKDLPNPLPVLIDRLVWKGSATDEKRLRESVEQAFRLNPTRISLWEVSGETPVVRPFLASFACPGCLTVFKKPTAEHFSFNHPLGACPTCEGFGRVMGLDMDRVVPDKRLTLAEGAIHPFTTPANLELQELLLAEAKKQKIRTNVPYQELSVKERQLVMEGAGEYPGVRAFFNWLESKKYKVHVRVTLARYRSYTDCPDCHGSRIRAEALHVFLGGKNIQHVTRLSVLDLLMFLEELTLNDREQQIASRAIQEVVSRLTYLKNVGLGYLTLARQARTLSGGESQRIHLASALGRTLTETLYVLDEPTVGLHPRDTRRLLETLKALRDQGNTLVVVEHDPEIIMGADTILDMGPAGGEEGGRIVYEGDLAGLLATPYSLTSRYLHQRGQTSSSVSSPRKRGSRSSGSLNSREVYPHEGGGGDDTRNLKNIEILGATGNNLKNLDVRIPTGQLVCVTGVSGSGKSTLIQQTLFAGYEQSQGRLPSLEPAPHRAIKGLDPFEEVVLVDQSPPARSARSNPITYIKAYDEIRTLFAQSRKAMALGLSAGDFSFNTAGGRCETCEGLGTVTVDMQFLADVTMVCPDCQGQRFTPAVLSIEVGGKNIHDVLNLTVDEAVAFFKVAPRVRSKLKPLQEIGLGYLKLGQSTSTLSGGEAQRLKLATYLKYEDAEKSGRYLFLFDEPTTGLHMADIEVLVGVLRRLVEAGHSLIVVEHNLDFIAQADHIIDLGPDGGDAGGALVAQGTPAEVAQVEESVTGQFLREVCV